ncbi:hypothetical protein LTR08_004713 [Meristemomyces frigidus]|nr:hypothetical protein LTR08_004713 [Meristemomyces frigidus]
MAHNRLFHSTKPTAPSPGNQHARERHISAADDMSLPTLKRHATEHGTHTQPSPKRPAHSTRAFDTSTNLVRRRPAGLSVPLEQSIAKSAADDDDGEFVDAREEPAPTDGAAAAGEDVDIEAEEDLFASTFANKARQTPRRAGQGDDEDDEYDSPSSRVTSAHPPQTLPTTTPPPPPPNTQKPPPPPHPPPSNLYPTAPQDFSPSLRAHQRFRARCIPFIPRLPLPAHRYWIGVLPADRKPHNIREEKQVVWMKGNRVTTVQTVWHSYQTSTMTEGFVLLLGGVEKVGMAVRCEEMDYFGDRKVLFWAVKVGGVGAGGRLVSEGCVPQAVVEID